MESYFGRSCGGTKSVQAVEIGGGDFGSQLRDNSDMESVTSTPTASGFAAKKSAGLPSAAIQGIMSSVTNTTASTTAKERNEMESMNSTVITVVGKTIDETVSLAQALQKRRESWKVVLDALPCPKVANTDFPYANMDQAIRDDFKLFDGGKDDAFRLLVKGFKTNLWRKGAEKNRDTRDAAADGEGGLLRAKRVRKPKAVVAKTEAAA